jgi:hypothetical protein
MVSHQLTLLPQTHVVLLHDALMELGQILPALAGTEAKEKTIRVII